MTSIEQITHEAAIEILSQTPEAKSYQGDWAKYIEATATMWVGVADGELVAMWGVIPPTLLSNSVYLWSYTFPGLANHIFTFVRGSQLVIEELLAHYEVITGHTDRKNTKAIKWLKWLGAKFDAENEFGMPFEIRAKHG